MYLSIYWAQAPPPGFVALATHRGSQTHPPKCYGRRFSKKSYFWMNQSYFRSRQLLFFEKSHISNEESWNLISEAKNWSSLKQIIFPKKGNKLLNNYNIYLYFYICIYMVTKFQIEHGYQNSNVKVCRPWNHLSEYAQTFPPGYLHLQEFTHRLRGSRAQNEQLKNKPCLDTQPLNDIFENQVLEE